MNKKNQITIFIVEDNEVYAKSLQGFLQICFPKIKEIKIFSIGETCLMEMNRNPDIVIMDYFLNAKYPEAHNGLEIIGRIKAQRSQTSIIVLSTQTDINVTLKAIKQFNCIYIQKDNEAFSKIEKAILKIKASKHLA